MKLTRKQLRKIISETYRGYRVAQRSSSAQYRNPSLEYSQILADLLRADLDETPIRANQYRMYYMHNEGTQVEIGLPGTVSWPHGASIMFEHPMDYERIGPAELQFPVTGNPEIDAKFINKLLRMSLLSLADLSDASRGYSIPSKSAFGPPTRVPPTMKRTEWYDYMSRIMDGYHGKYLQ